MKTVFLIPGMGADTRIYKHIQLDHSCIIPVEWIVPAATDTLSDYAQKLIDRYQISPGSILIGNSLGGMLAVEIANKIQLEKVILISSIKTRDEAPFYFSLFKWLPVYRIIPGGLFAKAGKLIEPIFGRMNSVDAYLFNNMLQNTSPVFLKWAMGAVLKWTNKTVPPNLYHITGTHDFVFNYKLIDNAILIEGGTHIMVFDRAAEINSLLAKILNQ